MDENLEFTYTAAEPEQRRKYPVKWLRYLFYTGIAGLVVSLLNMMSVAVDLTAWCSRLLSVAAVVCLFQLGTANHRYRKAGLYMAICVAGSVITALIPSGVVSLAATVFSLMSGYQEYQAHSKSLSRRDPVQSRRWRNLFYWEIAVSILISVASIVTTLATVEMEAGVTGIVSFVMSVIMLPTMILRGFYLMYLHRTLQILSDQEE